VEDGAFDYEDVVGEVMTGDRRIFARGVVVAGRWFE
jgi:dihydroorotase